MNTYTCKTFTGHWPVGSVAIVMAKNIHDAANKLNAELKEMGLPGDARSSDMTIFPIGIKEQVRVLTDGNY